jgi:hypothetical protein
MGCPDYYRLADWDGRQFWEFYRDECEPIVRFDLRDGEKHALQSACEHLFRRGFKGDEGEDVEKYRWWIRVLMHGFQPDDSVDLGEEYAAKKMRSIVRVLALVELRRLQKIGTWAELLPTSLEKAHAGRAFYDSSIDDAS